LDFLGRADDQVKVRGFRIEPGEIESFLRRQAEVTEAAVTAREDMLGHKQLVAYIVAAKGETIDGSDLRRRLAEHFPDYMVPAAIVQAPQLPRTPNGKLDRRALPAPEFIPTSNRVARTTQEETLASLFRDVLRLERVGIDDSFFELGGDSIRAIQLVGRARDAGLVISPRDIFQYQSVAALAGWLSPPKTANSPVRMRA
jgi:acyl carrier protein